MIPPLEQGGGGTVTALLASHNRREKTLACLDSYYSQAVALPTELGAVLVDDASSDGTAEAVRERFPATEIVAGSGGLYWAGAMELAERVAMRSPPDFLFWLNDDVVLDPDALARLIDVQRQPAAPAIVVGATRDPGSGALTYSGVRRAGRHPLRMTLVAPGDGVVEVETFNGNAVLVPRLVRETVGPIDGRLVHSAADHDYGLRARSLGIRTVLAPGTVGTCERDGDRHPWLEAGLPLRARLELFLGPKGFPPAARARYLRRHGGLAWPALWLWTYLRRMPRVLFPRRPGSAA